MTRVLLINSEVAGNPLNHRPQYFPLGLISIATLLRKHDIDVKILDAEHDLIDVRSIIEYNPDIVGIGAVFSGAFESMLKYIRLVKNTLPQLPIVIGGIHATIFAEQILRRYSEVDFIVKGEGEYSLLQLINGVNLDTISGLVFRKDNSIISNPNVYINDLDALPYPDYSLIDVKKYEYDTSHWYSPKGIVIGQPYPIISSRSCPYRCNFCCLWLIHGPKFRPRSANHVLGELQSLYDNGVTYLDFMDDNLTFDKQRTLDICNGIVRRNINIQFATTNGLAIAKLDQEVIDALVSAGMVRTALAVEHGNEYIRQKVMHKPINNKKIFDVADACAKHKNLFISAYFVVGLPQETQSTLDDTYNIIKQLPLDNFQVAFATPYPGTELYNYCVEHKLLSDEFMDGLLNNLTLHYNINRPHFKPHEIEIDDLISFKQKCFEYLNLKRNGLPNNLPLR